MTKVIHIKTAITGLTLTLFVPLSAFAQTPAATAITTVTAAAPTIVSTTPLTKQAVRQATQQQRLTQTETALKNRADTEIDRRTTSLNALITRINAFKRLTTDQKSSFATQIQTEITNLTNLRTKIDADTDTVTLRADIKSIVTEYRVFAFYIPQLRLLDTADRLLTLTDEMTVYATKLQTRIAQAQAQGSDVSLLQTSLTDMQAKIADAKTQAGNVITAISALTPAGYPANKTTLQSAKTMLMTARQDIGTAQSDAKTIIQGVKGIKQATNPATSSAVKTSTP